MKKKLAATSTKAAPSKGCPERLIKYQWKPGTSGNISGIGKQKSDKQLTRMLSELLAQVDPKDKKGRTFAQILVREMIDRAVKKSDLLLMTILDRIDGKLAPESMEERLTAAPPIIVLSDIPRPDNGMPPLLPRAKTLDVKPVKPGSNGKK